MSTISKTADKALGLLVELAALKTATPQQLAARTGTNRTVVQRLLTTLLARDLLKTQNGSYSLSYRARELAEAVQPELRRAVESHAAQLSFTTGETVVFQIIDGHEVVVLVEARQTHDLALQARHEVGSRSAIHIAASGLAILAALSDSEAKSLAGPNWTPDLQERILEARRTGFAYTSEELQQGVVGCATSVRNASGVAGSLAIIVPTTRAETLIDYRIDLERAASRIESSLR